MDESNAEPEPPALPRRRFGIGDTMIVVAACALWLYLCRRTFAGIVEEMTKLVRPPIKPVIDPVWMAYQSTTRPFVPSPVTIWELTAVFVEFWMTGVVIFMAAVLLLRLRPPRPGPRQMLRQRGILASGLIVFPMLYCAYLRTMDRPLFETMTIVYFCAVVPLTWMGFWWNRSWDVTADWVEKTGRWLGWSWMGGTICAACVWGTS